VQFGTTAVQWQAGLVANASVTSANTLLANELRFVGYDSVAAIGAGSTVTAGVASDFAANTGTEAHLALNATGSGSIALPRDMDWFRIDVQAGQSYTVAVNAAAGSLLDAYLRLYDANGRLIGSDDDSGPGSNARLNFVANQTTHLFLSAGGFGSSTGSYILGFEPRGLTQTGGAGADRLTGGLGADRLSGLSGNDTLIASAGNDRLSGDEGNDVLYGGTGRDVIDGGTGRDTLFGGSGADVFVFQQGDGLDSLRDFQNGVDRLQVEGVRGFSALAFSTAVGGTWVDYGNGAVYVSGMTRAQFDASDFVFA
jgi:Ca2+-binding RTX toxin-like protein